MRFTLRAAFFVNFATVVLLPTASLALSANDRWYCENRSPSDFPSDVALPVVPWDDAECQALQAKRHAIKISPLSSLERRICEGNPIGTLARELQANPECSVARKQHVTEFCRVMVNPALVPPDMLREPECKKAIEQAQAAANAKSEAARAAANQAEKDRLSAIEALPIGNANKASLREHRLFIGATPKMAQLAWGTPARVVRTVTATNTSEKWIYPVGDYLIFDDGQVTTMQTSR